MKTNVTVSIAFFSGVVTALSTGAEVAGTLQQGTASWYGPDFQGRLTATGERFDTHDLTAAHKTIPFGTKVRVTNKHTGQSVVVHINDRGPLHGRVIDLSKASAEAIGLSGLGEVTLAQI